MAQAIEDLYPENLEAWRVFQAMGRRFVVDTGLMPDVFRLATKDADSDTVEGLLDRLALIYDIVQPEKQR